MSEFLLNQLKISPYQLRVFFLSCISMFIIVALHTLGFQSPLRIPNITLPQKIDIMQSITPKLEQKPNVFILKNKQTLIPSQKMKIEEPLNASLLTSANYAAEEIRDGINQKYKGGIFIPAMNEKASFLKLSNTHFANPEGFDAVDNYSSADDLAVLASYA